MRGAAPGPRLRERLRRVFKGRFLLPERGWITRAHARARSPRDRSGGRRASARGRSEAVRVCSLSSAVTGVTSADPRQRLACAARCKWQAGHNLGAGVEEAASGKLFLPPPSVSGNHPGLWPLVGSRRSTREPESFHLNFKSLTLPRQMRANKTSARRGF